MPRGVSVQALSHWPLANRCYPSMPAHFTRQLLYSSLKKRLGALNVFQRSRATWKVIERFSWDLASANHPIFARSSWSYWRNYVLCRMSEDQIGLSMPTG